MRFTDETAHYKIVSVSKLTDKSTTKVERVGPFWRRQSKSRNDTHVSQPSKVRRRNKLGERDFA